MDIIVCIKQVPGTNKVDIDPSTGTLKRDGVSSKMNPYDLFALECALALKEKNGGTVKTVSMGPPQAKAVLQESLWMGADGAMLLSDRAFGGADVLATSYCLSLGVEKLGKYDLILTGKQTTDGDTAQVGPELAERLGIEHAANVLRIDAMDEKSVTVTLDLDGVEQTQRMAFPCLLTVEKDMNTPRLPSYLRKKAVKDEQIAVCSLGDFPQADKSMLGLKGSPTQVERIFPPAVRSGQSKLTGTPEELASGLYTMLVNEKFI